MMDRDSPRGRKRFAPCRFPRDNVRALLRKLRDELRRRLHAGPDLLSASRPSSCRFSASPRVTNTAMSKLATISGAAVLPFFFSPLPDPGLPRRHRPAAPGFPSDDPAADARFFGRLEDYIRLAPEQYLWMYKKFKGRPAPYTDVYAVSADRREP